MMRYVLSKQELHLKPGENSMAVMAMTPAVMAMVVMAMSPAVMPMAPMMAHMSMMSEMRMRTMKPMKALAFILSRSLYPAGNKKTHT